MKDYALIAVLFVAACLFIPPTSAASWTNINQGIDSNSTNWSASQNFNHTEFSLNAWTLGDGSLGDPYWYHYEDYNAWVQWNNPLGIYYSKVRLYGFDNTLWTCNGVTLNVPSDTWVNFSITGGGPVRCENESAYYARLREIQYENGTPPAPIANFTASATNATAPAYIAFTDTSENEYGTCTYNWSFTPTDGVLAAPQDMDNEDITMLFTQNGDFTISHGVSCDAGSNISTKTDYIHITNSTALSTFRVRAVDALSGYGINGAQVDVFDIENSSWTNQTSVTGEVTVTALTGHNINAYGSATGYDDGESLGLPVVAGSLYPIYVWPSTFATNVSEGNVTLYVTVLESGINTRLSGMSVSLSAGTGGADYTIGQTNENGIFQTTVRNQTNYLVTILKQKGYLGASKSFNSGTQSGGDAYVEVTIYVDKEYITTAPTVTTLPGGGTPSPTQTYLQYCNPSASDYDQAKCRTSHSNTGLNYLAENMDTLIMLCVMVTMLYLLGVKLGGRR